MFCTPHFFFTTIFLVFGLIGLSHLGDKASERDTPAKRSWDHQWRAGRAARAQNWESAVFGALIIICGGGGVLWAILAGLGLVPPP